MNIKAVSRGCLVLGNVPKIEVCEGFAALGKLPVIFLLIWMKPESVLLLLGYKRIKDDELVNIMPTIAGKNDQIFN